MSNKVNKTEAKWKEELSEEEYFVLREKGTERPFSGKFNLHFEAGTYVCKGCGNALFSSEAKFESHCGWPSFDQALEAASVIEQVDYSHGMVRKEILCAHCGGHLGHVFSDGPTDTKLRYCINSVALEFVKVSE